MSSPVRRAFELLRQHFLLLSGPWLGVCAGGTIVVRIVQQFLLRIYPVFDPRMVRGTGYVTMHQALSNSLRGIYIRLGIGECVQILVCGFEVIALAVMVLLVMRVASQGHDTFSGALDRLGKIPAAIGNLLKFYVIVLLVGVGAALVEALPVLLLVPLRLSMHLTTRPGLWVGMVSAYLGLLFFALCVMPFFLNLVWRLLPSSGPDDEAPEGLLKRALGYAAVAVGAEVALRLLMRPLLVPLGMSPPAGALLRQSLIGLAANLIVAVPTIVCVVVITLMVMDAAQPVTEAEPA
jgi:hypothetical protein